MINIWYMIKYLNLKWIVNSLMHYFGSLFDASFCSWFVYILVIFIENELNATHSEKQRTHSSLTEIGPRVVYFHRQKTCHAKYNTLLYVFTIVFICSFLIDIQTKAKH